MGVAIPADVQAWLKGQTFWHLTTLGADGTPQASPVWADTDGTHVIVNSVIGRTKDRNMRADPRVAMSAVHPENAYQTVEIKGRVVEVVEGQPAEDMIDDLAEKYLNQRPYPWRTEADKRVTFKIEPTFIGGFGR